jgi:hypothetical protein
MVLKDYTQNKNFDDDFLIYHKPNLLWNNLVGKEGVLFLHIKNNPKKSLYCSSLVHDTYWDILEKILND